MLSFDRPSALGVSHGLLGEGTSPELLLHTGDATRPLGQRMSVPGSAIERRRERSSPSLEGLAQHVSEASYVAPLSAAPVRKPLST